MATVDDVTQPDGEPNDQGTTPATGGEDSSGERPPVEHVAEAIDLASEPEAIPFVEASLAWDESVSACPLSVGWDAEPAVIDWYGEGKPDLLVSHGGGPGGRSARVFRRVGKDETTHSLIYDAGVDVEGLDGLRCLCPIPNGRASRFDLVALAPEGLVLLRNHGSAQAPVFSSRESLGLGPDLGFGVGQVAQMVSVDWDGDGKIDLLVGFDAMPDYWPDPALPVEQQVGLNQRGGHPGYDRRGLWRGTKPEGRLHWLQNVGTVGEPRFEPRPEISSDLEALELGMHPAPLAVAWGGGGGLELMAIDERGMVKLYRNFGGQRPPVLMEPRSLTCGGATLVLPEERTVVIAADIDGDRKVELVYGTADGRVFVVHSGSGRDSAHTPLPVLSQPASLRMAGRSVLTVGDLDGDGGIDLIFGDGPGRLSWMKDVGVGPTHRYVAPHPIEAGGEPYQVDPGPDGRLLGPIAPKLGHAAPALVDWMAHGRLDLVVGTAGGDVLVFTNDGSRTQPRFAYPVPLKCSGAPLITPSRVRPAVAHWSGAELPDLITLDLQGFLAVFPREKPTELGSPEPIVDRLGRLIRLDGGFGQGGRCALWAGDWTGSGRVDLLVGLPREARYLIPGLIGRAVRSLENLPTVLLLENIGHNAVVPRGVYLSDGRPLVVGTEGCSPCGVDGTNSGRTDLIVGSDDGQVHYYRRDELTW